MKSLGEILKLSSEHLKSRKILRSRRVAEELIGEVLNLKRLDLYLQFDRPIDEKELTAIRTLLKRAATGEPVEYILQKGRFYECFLYLDSRVLIPRPETEILVDKIHVLLKSFPSKGKILLDLCCGSGCLGIALKKKFDHLRVILSDFSEDALEVAIKNASLNAVSVDFLKGDLLSPLQGQKIDFLICNPPYVSEEEYWRLDPSVRDFEPKMALVGGKEGLDFYRRLEKELPAHLNLGAKVFFEIGYLQADAMKKIFSASYWKNKRVEQDFAGHDRFFFLEFE